MSDTKQKLEKRMITAIIPVEIECAFEDIFYALASAGEHKYISFLDSSLTPNKFSNYSYLAWDPEFAVKSSGIKNEIMDLRTGAKEEISGHPLKFLEQMLKNNITGNTGSIYLDDSSSDSKSVMDQLSDTCCYQGIDPKSGVNHEQWTGQQSGSGHDEAISLNSDFNHEQGIGQQSGSGHDEAISLKSDFNHEQGIGQQSGTSHDEATGQQLSNGHDDDPGQKADYAVAGDVVLPDYRGGFVGYFSYDLKNYIEKLPAKAKKDIKVEVFYLCYYLKFLAFNHKTGRCYFIKNYKNMPDRKAGGASCDENYKTGSFLPGNEVSGEKSFTEHIRGDMSQEKQKVLPLLKHSRSGHRQKINGLIMEKYKAKQVGNLDLVSNFSKPDYIRAILKTKEHIHNGDIYQANISQRFSCSINVDPFDLYYMLRQKNSAPFCAYLSFPGLQIGSSSPERFIFLKDGQVQTRPIKGTRPRGKTPEEDDSYIKELQESLKDHAELNMIVDLERNDLGRFCKYGTVKVKEHAVVEKYARVFHLVSTVTGQLQEGYSHTDIIKAAFPGGSITGAPKIRAMEIIDSLEPTARNIYTGSMGYIGLDGTMDLNIAIRTFVIKNKKFYYNVGGGIVEDSVPESEYTETLDKGVALKETLEYFSQKNMDLLKDN